MNNLTFNIETANNTISLPSLACAEYCNSIIINVNFNYFIIAIILLSIFLLFSFLNVKFLYAFLGGYAVFTLTFISVNNNILMNIGLIILLAYFVIMVLMNRKLFKL